MKKSLIHLLLMIFAMSLLAAPGVRAAGDETGSSDRFGLGRGMFGDVLAASALRSYRGQDRDFDRLEGSYKAVEKRLDELGAELEELGNGFLPDDFDRSGNFSEEWVNFAKDKLKETKTKVDDLNKKREAIERNLESILASKSDQSTSMIEFFNVNAQLENELKELDKQIKEHEKSYKAGVPGMMALVKRKRCENARFMRHLKILQSRLDPKTTGRNFITQSMTTSKFDEIFDVSFDKLEWRKDILPAAWRGLQIEVVSSLGRSIAHEVNGYTTQMVRPFFVTVKDYAVALYRRVFKGGRSPFDAGEISYWRDSISNSLNLLIDSSGDIAKNIDRDRVARKRDLQRDLLHEMAAQQGQSELLEQLAGRDDAQTSNFADTILRRCVVSQFDRIISYIAQRRAYYGKNVSQATREGQILDLSRILSDALRTVKNEIDQQDAVKSIAAPEFSAIIPHYARYVANCFDELAHLVALGQGIDDQKKVRTSPLSGGRAASKRKGNGMFGGLD